MRRVLVCLSLVSCAGASFEFQPIAALPKVDAGRHKDAEAVVLLRQLSISEPADPGLTGYTQYRRHDIIHILSEAGFDHAQVKIWLGEKDELEYLHARTIAPDGTEQKVTPQEVLEDDAKVGKKKEKTKYKQKIFRFPGVSVGSRIEYAYSVGSPHIITWDTERVTDDIPIDRYELELALNKNVVGAIALFNRPESFLQTRDGSVVHFKVTLQNLPAHEKGWFPTPWQDHEPWWAFRVARLQYGTNYRLLNDTWERTLSNVASSLYTDTGKWTKGAPKLLDASACGKDKKCVVTKAMDKLYESVELKNFVSNLSSARLLKEAVDEKLANNFEKAMLAYHMLDDNGVDVRYVLVGRDDGLVFEREFPLPNQFDHLLLYVAAQEGIAAPIFVDPSCEHCTPGQLPTWVSGKEGVIIAGRRDVNVGVRGTLEFKRLVGTPAMPSGPRREHTIKVSGQDVEGAVDITNEGADAVDDMVDNRDKSERDWKEAHEKWVKARVKSGELVESKPAVCDRKKAVCVEKVRYKVAQHLVADGDGMLLPLELAYSSYDSPDRKLAAGALHGWVNARYEDVLNIDLAKSYEATALPKSVTLKTAVVDVECEATKSTASIRFRRTIRVKEGDVPASRRGEVEAALKAFSQCRRELIPLKKK